MTSGWRRSGVVSQALYTPQVDWKSSSALACDQLSQSKKELSSSRLARLANLKIENVSYENL